MNRCAKILRTISGLFLLADLIVFFLPVLEIRQDNYPTIRYSQLDFVRQLFLEKMSTGQVGVIIAFILLPALLALLFGIIGIVGSDRQIVSGIGSILVLGLVVAFYFTLGILEPDRLNEAQEYKKDFGLWLCLGLSAVAAICGISGLIATPRRQKKQKETTEKKQEVIPPQEQEAQKESQTAEQPLPAYVPEGTEAVQQPVNPEGARGVMVGLSGDYQGAEIPFKNGETLKLGRDASNDLIFVNASRVSRFHCTLTWIAEQQKFQIVDKSSNGSFINGLEECIPQNIAIYLEPGTILDIGNEQNRFRLE